MQSLLFLLVSIFIATSIVHAQIPCDDAYGQHCPEAAGFEVGDCLKKLDASVLSQECSDYINLHDVCKDDIVTHCNGKEYSGDALVCLSEWTQPSLLSADCLAALPKKIVKEKVLSAEAKKKADKRRRIRNKAAKMAREF